MTSKYAERVVRARRGGPLKSDRLAGSISKPDTKPARVSQVAAIETGRSSQVRLHLTTWREQTRLEFKPYSATVPQIFMPCGPGVTIPVEQIPELLKAVLAAERECIARGWL
jgi:hypothetical protein